MSRSEIMAILIYFHFNTFRNFKHYYLFYVKNHLCDFFPSQLSYNRFIEQKSRVAIRDDVVHPAVLFRQVYWHKFYRQHLRPGLPQQTHIHGTRCSMNMQRLARVQWDGILALSFI